MNERYQHDSINQDVSSFSSSTNYNFVILHGYTEHSNTGFFPWLKNQLEYLSWWGSSIESTRKNPTENIRLRIGSTRWPREAILDERF